MVLECVETRQLFRGMLFSCEKENGTPLFIVDAWLTDILLDSAHVVTLATTEPLSNIRVELQE